MNSLGDTLKSGKAQKSSLVPMSSQEKLTDLFLVFPVRLETLSKAFHSYSRNEALRHFSVNFDACYKNLTSAFAMYFQVL